MGPKGLKYSLRTVEFLLKLAGWAVCLHAHSFSILAFPKLGCMLSQKASYYWGSRRSRHKDVEATEMSFIDE